MGPRRVEHVRLATDPDRLAELVRALAASVNTRILATLADDRRRRGDDAWLTLSDTAERIQEAPGTVAAAIGKLQLAGLVTERRDKGRRWFRANLTDLHIEIR